MLNFEECLFSIDKTAVIENHIKNLADITIYDMMFRSANVIFKELYRNIKNDNDCIFFFCGGGKNGGDGYLTATLAKNAGLKVRCIDVSQKHKQIDKNDSNYDFATNEAIKKAENRLLNAGIILEDYSEDIVPKAGDIIVDAIFGTGCKQILSDFHIKLIKKINKMDNFVLSIDLPSGLCGNTGEVMNVAVKSDITITLITLKQGLFLKNARQYYQNLKYRSIYLHKNFKIKISPNYYRLDRRQVKQYIPKSNNDTHKGIYGHLLLVGGNRGMEGAIVLAAEAASRSGVGNVTVLTRKSTVISILSRIPNVRTETDYSQRNIDSLLSRVDAIVIGPGLGYCDQWSKSLFKKLIFSPLPKIIDADGLYLLKKYNFIFHIKNFIITPHEKEAAHLLSIKPGDVHKYRKNALAELYKTYKAVVVLKGSTTLILGDSKKFFLSNYGHPGMATAGCGDVLSGIIGSFLAQGFDRELSTKLAVIIHGIAGDEVAKDRGEIGLSPMDLIQKIPYVINNTRH